MAVDLDTLVDPLKRAVNPPGANLYPTATTLEWVGRLADAFWDARLKGFFVGYHLNEDMDQVLADTAADEIPRDLQQVIVIYAAYRVTRQRLIEFTSTRYKAGPVEAEVTRSANVLVQLLKDLAAELEVLRAEVAVTRRKYATTGFFDLVAIRDRVLIDSGGWVR